MTRGQKEITTQNCTTGWPRRWQDVERDYRNLDRRKATDAMIFRWYVVQETLSLWGKPEDTDLEAFRSKNIELS